MHWFYLEKRLTAFTRWLAFLGFFLLLLLSLIIVIDIFMRWLFHAPLAGTGDISKVLLPVIVSTCFPIAVHQRRHVTIRFLGNSLGPRRGTYLELFGSLVLLVFLLLMSWQLILHTAEMQAAREHTWVIQILMAPWWWVTTAIMASCLPLQSFIVLSCLIRVVTGRSPDGAPQIP